jgi:hypothetical protein
VPLLLFHCINSITYLTLMGPRPSPTRRCPRRAHVGERTGAGWGEVPKKGACELRPSALLMGCLASTLDSPKRWRIDLRITIALTQRLGKTILAHDAMERLSV